MILKKMKLNSQRMLMCGLLALAILSACGDDDGNDPDPGSAESPEFTILSSTFNFNAGEGANYLMTINSLDEAASQDNSSGIELPIYTSIRTYEGDVFHYGTALLTKYVLDDAGELQPSGSLDLGAYGGGISDIDFMSSSKAYVTISRSFVEINPSTMQLVEAVEYSGIEGLEDFQDLNISASETVIRGTELFSSIFIFNNDFTPDGTPDSVIVVSMNTGTNELLESTFKPGAANGGDNYGARGMFIEDGSGDIYIQSHAFWGDKDIPTALVRIPNGSRQFDGYFWDLTEACGDRKTLHAFYAGGNTAYTKAYYPEAGNYFSAFAHKWWELDFAAQTATEMAVDGFTTGYWSQVGLVQGDKFYFPISDASTNTVYEYDASLGNADDPTAFRSVLTLDQGVLNGIESLE